MVVTRKWHALTLCDPRSTLFSCLCSKQKSNPKTRNYLKLKNYHSSKATSHVLHKLSLLLIGKYFLLDVAYMIKGGFCFRDHKANVWGWVVFISAFPNIFTPCLCMALWVLTYQTFLYHWSPCSHAMFFCVYIYPLKPTKLGDLERVPSPIECGSRRDLPTCTHSLWYCIL